MKTTPAIRTALLAAIAVLIFTFAAAPLTRAQQYASDEANAFVAQFDPFVDEYVRLGEEAAKTGDITKFKAFDDAPQSEALMMKSQALGKTLAGDDEVRFRKYMNEQMRRLFAANRAAKNAAATAGTATGERFASADVNAYARELEASVAKILSLAQEASETKDVTQFNAYVNSPEAVALKAKGEQIKKNLTGEDKERFDKYMLEQMAPLLIAYGMIQKISPGNAQASASAGSVRNTAPPPSAPKPSATRPVSRGRAWDEAFRLLGAVGINVTPDSSATIPGDPGRPTFPDNNDANDLMKKIDDLVSRYLDLFQSGDANALAKFRDPVTGFMGEIIKLGALERRVRPTLPDNYQDAVIEYLNDQRARLAAALAKAAASGDTQPATPPPAPPTSPAPAGQPAAAAPSFTTPKPPAPAVTNPKLNAFVKELDTYVEGVVAAADEALQTRDYNKFRRYFGSVGRDISAKHVTASKGATKEESNRVAAYYSAQMKRRSEAWLAVDKASKGGAQ